MPPFRLERSAGGYALVDEADGRTLRVDFTSARLLHRLNYGGKELLVQAAKARAGLSVLDATTGLGVDSLVLASKGCMVTMLERSHTLYLMLQDALARASQDSRTQEVAMRMRVLRGDARFVMAHLDDVPDVIVIDPMFPPRRKRAAVRGDLQLMQQFLGMEGDARSLTLAARATGCKRVVVKRPLAGGDMPGLVPSFTVKGKASRFDVFVR